MPMLQAADYRKRARECEEIALTVKTAAQRTMLMHIAETWLRLALDAESLRANGHAATLPIDGEATNLN